MKRVTLRIIGPRGRRVVEISDSKTHKTLATNFRSEQEAKRYAERKGWMVSPVTISENEKVARELVVLARDILSSDGTIGAFGGEEYHWPRLSNDWELIRQEHESVWGDFTLAVYQHYDTGHIIEVNLNNWLVSEGDNPGTWTIEAYGKTKSGRVNGPNDVKNALEDAIQWAELEGKIAYKKAIPIVSGWDVPRDDGIFITYDLKRKSHVDEEMLVLFSEGNASSLGDVLLNDQTGEATMRYEAEHDYGGARGVKEKTVGWSGADGIKKVLKEADRFYEKESKNWYD